MMYEEPKNICGVCKARFHNKPDLYRHWKNECRYGKTKGLCHSCLTSDVELINEKGHIICMDCYHKKQKQSQENKEPPTMDDLKRKWEK